MTIEFQFTYDPAKRAYVLLANHTVLMQSWVKSSYSREKALNRAHRWVGNYIMSSDAKICVTYSQTLPEQETETVQVKVR